MYSKDDNKVKWNIEGKHFTMKRSEQRCDIPK